MSFFGFTIAGAALDAFQSAENVTSNNIANVQTPGASRQNAILAEQIPVTGTPFMPANANGQPGTLGDGVLLSKITRTHQDSYDVLYRGATASQNFYSVEQQQLSATQSGLGEPANGINAAYVAFQSSVQQLSSDPTGTASRSAVLAAAGGLVQSLNQASSTLTNQLAQVQGQAAQVVITVNNDLDQIAALNGQIRALTATGENPNTYLDQRDALIDQVSTLIPTQTQLQANGSSLVTLNGQALVNDTVAYHIAPPVIGTDANGLPVLKVGLASDPNPGNPTALVIGSGQLGGYLDLYNNKLTPYSQSLNNVANALVSESGRLTQGAYDINGVPGGLLFTASITGQPVGAGNIKVGLNDPSQIPTVVASTQSGTLTVAANSANNTVDTSQALINNTNLANPPAAQLNGTLTINVDGTAQVLNYQVGGVVPAGTIDATTIDSFVNGFNGQHVGVTASFDASSQRIVFARDPSNIDLVHRANILAAAGATAPDFTMTDSLAGAGPSAEPALGTAATSLLSAIGASQINGVKQNATNAFGQSNTGGLIAYQTLFTQNVGVPAQQLTSPTAIAAAGSVTVSVASAAGFHIGDTLTLDAQADGGNPQENVTITNVDYLNNKITFTVKNDHAAGFTITSAQTTTVQGSYAAFVAKLGLDTQTVTTGNSSQTTLSANINQVRQGIDGINVDEETQNLIKYQNAYGAAAHVVSILDTMLLASVNLGGFSFT